MSRLLIAGSRSIENYDHVKCAMQLALQEFKIEISNIKTVMSGNAKGTDRLGEKWAKENEIEIKLFIPDWSKHGKIAGLLRNSDMLQESDYVVCIYDGKSNGTKDTINKAKKLNKLIYVHTI